MPVLPPARGAADGPTSVRSRECAARRRSCRVPDGPPRLPPSAVEPIVLPEPVRSVRTTRWSPAARLPTCLRRPHTPEMDFPEHLHRRLRAGLLDAACLPPGDVYALSLYWSYEDDEPSRPRLELAWNTEQRVRWVLRHEHPLDEAEARWNYAYWAAAATGEYLTGGGERLPRAVRGSGPTSP